MYNQHQKRLTLISAILSLMVFLLAPAVHSAEVTLSWEKPNDSRVLGYYIYCGISGTDFTSTPIETINSADQTSCLILNLEEGQLYDFAATSFDADFNESAFSETINFYVESLSDDDGDGYVGDDGDCNDDDASIFPGAIEICGDGVDQDCDGSDLDCIPDIDNIDNDGDGYTENDGDCDDDEASVNPGAIEVCGDGIDQDCNGGDRVCVEDPEAQSIVFGNALGADFPGTLYDTFINLNEAVNSSSEQLNTYTWPENMPANAILLQFDLSQLPIGAQIQSATLSLYQTAAGGDSSYDIGVHKVINHNPDLNQANGYTCDGIMGWTANDNCYNNVPLAQADIAPAEFVNILGHGSGYKEWDVAGMVQDWANNPIMNYGLLLNSDSLAASSSYRYFASSEATDAARRPRLEVVFISTVDGLDPQDMDNDGDSYTENEGDCDDSAASVYPGATEICGDGIDQDCNGSDLTCPEDVDNDNDGYTENEGDFNDNDAAINPGAAEICGDGIDQDCDGGDLECTPDPEDIDNDGDGYSENEGDCDDSAASVYPGATEICGDGIDQDCNGSDLTCPEDVDNDNDGYTENEGDFNDNDAAINPGAAEICGDGIDQDCDGGDLECTPDPEDIDNDGDGYSENEGDCDDSAASVYPGATEICGDGIDQDCNDSDLACPEDVDNDNDGYTENEGDFNDNDAAINPGAAEICGDGIDQDCDGSDLECIPDPEDIDNDGDGYSENEGDCDDSAASVYPGAIEICGDGIDQDCDGSDEVCTIMPAAPTGVAASDGTFSGQIQVTWDAVSGSGTYDLYRADLLPAWSGTSPIKIASSISETYYNDTTAVSGNRYYYWVKSRNSNGQSRYSKFNHGYWGSVGSRPPTPTGIFATEGSASGKVSIMWNATSNTLVYEIWRADIPATLGGKLKKIGISTTTSFDDTNVVEGNRYYYWIKSRNSWNVSRYSILDTGYVGTEPSRLSAPAFVSATDGAISGKVNITWDAVTGAIVYEVWRATKLVSVGGTPQRLGCVSDSTFDDTSADSDTIYYYWVKARDSWGPSKYSAFDTGYFE